MPTTFIAVQCFQCATMQVKQQKKSGNKWTCVVCNEKQSVRRVFARGFMAKDVRKFVQSFNMSRQIADQQLPDEETLEFPPAEAIDDQISGHRKKKRTDWTEYLDPEDEVDRNGENEDIDDVNEPNLVTELPKAVFKKPKLKNYTARSHSGNDEKLFRPTFAQRNSNKQIVASEAAEEIKSSKFPPKQRDRITQDEDDRFEDKATWKVRHAEIKKASKWSEYIDEDCGGDENGRDFADENDAEFAVMSNDQRFEEDIHPDFL